MKIAYYFGGFSVFAMLMFLVACAEKGVNSTEVTFFVAADTHFDPPPESDQYYHVLAMNHLPGNLKWPEKINGKPTYFGSANSLVSNPQAVILAGDILDKADSSALELFRQRYEKGLGDKQIHFPVYVGLGNHDINPVIDEPARTLGQQRMFRYVESRHKGTKAPVPVTNFDSASYNYSWEMGGVHFVQTNLFAGATSNNQLSSLMWLQKDLQKNAANHKPVIIIQHYGIDDWAAKWWTDEEKNKLYQTLKPYHVVGIFAGHTHFAQNFDWHGIPLFEVNNAWSETSGGNKDGNGSFAVIRITNKYIDMATCRWKNDKGEVEWAEPFFHKTF
jgi:cytolysin (calcineurin-like family phosphatase)